MLLSRLKSQFLTKDFRTGELAENKHLPSRVKETYFHSKYGKRAENCRNRGREEDELRQGNEFAQISNTKKGSKMCRS